MDVQRLLKQCPGKSSVDGVVWLPLWMHCRDTAAIMGKLAEYWIPAHMKDEEISGMSAEEFVKLSRFLGMVHDIGKLTPIFAARITERLQERRPVLEAGGLLISTPDTYPEGKHTPHAGAGERILLFLGCPDGVAAVVGAHHGKPQSLEEMNGNPMEQYWRNFYGSEGKDSASGRLWEQLWKELACQALQACGFKSLSALPELDVPMQLFFTGLLIMADWIASNPTYFPLISVDDCGAETLYPEREERAWETLGLPNGWEPMRFVMDEERFRTVFDFGPDVRPRAVQSMMIQAVNRSRGGIYILEAQMGVGKTEAALAAAEVLATKEQCDGIFFGLPTQATANGLFGRLADWAGKQTAGTSAAIRLAHGMAELNMDYRAIFRGRAAVEEDGADSLIVHPWFRGRKQALLANFVIGTVDQLLMAALKQKHVMLRHLGLASKVVILDECHAYDAYMNQYLDRALNWLGAYHVPVIMLSATLPEERRVKLVEAYLNGAPESEPANWRTNRAYPLLTWTSGREVCQDSAETEGAPRSVAIRGLESSMLADAVRDAIAEGGCCGVIVNTVSTAQRLAHKLAESIPDAEVVLLHSRFVAPDRAAKEEVLLRRLGKKSGPTDRDRLIVVGTQVLEQSLDIDFDILFTQLCPMDLLLQRLGRLHRHNRQRPAKLRETVCWILDFTEEPDAGSLAVYGAWLLLRTRELLPETVMLPDSIPELVQETYHRPDEALPLDPDHRKAWEDHDNLIRRKEEKAKSYRVNKPPKRTSRRKHSFHGWLDASHPADGVRGEAAVRDGEASISVLVMQEHADGNITFLPWQHGGATVSATHAPDEETALAIAGQRLTLPIRFSKYGREEQTIGALESLNRRKLPEWQNAGWLQGELILLLDEQLKTTLCGQTLLYSREYGLTCLPSGKEAKHGTQL